MIFGLGADIIETHRFAERTRRTEGLISRIFSPREVAACESGGRGAEKLAALFAAKEAFLKAMGTGWSGGHRFRDIEIIGEEGSRPEAVLNGKVKAYCSENGITGFHISISHSRDMAGAAVVLEKD